VTPRPPSRRALSALALLGVGALALAACSGGGGPTTATASTTTTAEVALQIIVVDVGRRFAIGLPADPAHGWRWVVDPVDTTFLAPLGSEFREDPVLLANATTTTTAAPPPETTTTLFTGRTTTTTEPTPTTEGPTTTTTAPGPLVQIVSYAGRADGQTKVTLRYERIGTGGQASEPSDTVVFTVNVGPLPLPPAPPA
jgi:predicted secreted protein